MIEKLVTVIVPVYNCQEYISICVESIIKQSYRNIELLLLNDGSTDSSKDICEALQKKDERIRLITQENIGVSKTRQKGLKLAKGEFIVFIDSDDYIDEDYIERLYYGIQEENADMCCCNCVDEGIMDQPNICIEKNQLISQKKLLLEDYFAGKRYAFVVWGKIYKKSILQEAVFKELKYTEDTYLIINLFDNCKKVKLLSYAGYHYRYQPNSVMAKRNEINLFHDTLITAEYVCQVTKNIDGKLFGYAKEKMIQKVYGAIAVNCRYGTKEEFRKFVKEIQEYYVWLDKKSCFKEKKGIIVFYFNKLPYVIKNILCLGYGIRKKIRK